MATLKRGSKGTEVKRLQSLLGLVADGIFGPKTEAAVRDFQQQHALSVDGVVGSKTWAALGVEVASGDVTIKCEDLKQYSAPHGSMVYGPDKSYSTYKSGGCGVVSFAIVQRAYGLVPAGESATETIQRLGKYAWEHGYRVKGSGTTAGLFKTNGCSMKSTSSRANIEAALRSEKLVILLIKNGFGNGYTGTGHYIVAYGIKGTDVLLRDVGSSKSKRQKVPLAKITSGLKSAYIITK